jgi:hypothetical protein
LDIISAEIISAALAPILLISGAGLLALSIQNRYGRVIDRIREFNTEMREKISDKRRESIDIQTELLVKRGIFLRNSLFLLFFSVILSSLSSFIILLEALTSTSLEPMATIFFSMALLSMFTGMIYAILDVSLSYDAIEKEIEIERS